MRRIFSAALLWLGLAAAAAAQTFPGQLPAWNLFGNPSGSSADPQAATVMQMLNGVWGTPSAGFVPIATDAAHAAWGVTPPNWGTLNTLYQSAVFNLGSLPTGSMDAHNSGSVAMIQALVGAIDVPGTANAANTFQNNGVAGYARSALAGAPAVGLFGGGMANVAGALAWGMNTICTNAPQIIPLTSTGLNNVNCYGAEFDVNIMKLPGGTTPTGTVRGIAIFGGSEVKPSGGAYGIEVGSLSQTFKSTVAWDAAIVVDEAPNTIGILIGANGTGSTSLPSQNIVFSSFNAGSANLQSQIFADANGNMIIRPATSAFVSLQDSGGATVLGALSNSILANQPITGKNLTMTTAAPAVAAAQIGYGSTTVAPNTSTCPTGTVGTKTVVGCIVVNVAGTTQYLPYF